MLDVEKAIKNLLDIKEVLVKNNVSWWIDGGTCLGAYREKGFITHDTDTDIGVLEETFSDGLIQAIQNKGFTLNHTFGSRNKGYELAFTRDGIKTDIFFYYLVGDNRWYAMYHKGKMIPMVYDFKIFEEQKDIDFYGHKFKVPGDVVGYLTTKYGEDYMIPHTQQWEWWHGPKNIDLNFIK